MYIILLFPFLESNGGSVEGYCAGEKEALDTVNKWVRLFLFSFLLCTVMTVVLELGLNHQISTTVTFCHYLQYLKVSTVLKRSAI